MDTKTRHLPTFFERRASVSLVFLDGRGLDRRRYMSGRLLRRPGLVVRLDRDEPLRVLSAEATPDVGRTLFDVIGSDPPPEYWDRAIDFAYRCCDIEEAARTAAGLILRQHQLDHGSAHLMSDEAVQAEVRAFARRAGG
jgi:hypothetical protein